MRTKNWFLSRLGCFRNDKNHISKMLNDLEPVDAKIAVSISYLPMLQRFLLYLTYICHTNFATHSQPVISTLD
jgi:hypothetical protein